MTLLRGGAGIMLCVLINPSESLATSFLLLLVFCDITSISPLDFPAQSKRAAEKDIFSLAKWVN